MSSESKVGLFALLAIILLGLWTFRVGNFSFFTKKSAITLYVTFDTAAGLDNGALVKVSGVDAGKVQNIKLINGKPVITLIIEKDIKIYSNAEASIVGLGLMGEKHVEIKPGTANHPLIEDGGAIVSTLRSKGFSDIGGEIAILMDDVRETIGLMKYIGQDLLVPIMKDTSNITTQLKEAIRADQEILNQLMININTIITQNQEMISAIIANTENLSSGIAKDTPRLMFKMQEILDQANNTLISTQNSVNSMSDTINSMTEPTNKLSNLVASLNQTVNKINNGEGTLGKLISDDELYNGLSDAVKGATSLLGKTESMKLYLGFRSEYMTEFKKAKSYFQLKFQPREDKYYLVEIIDDFQGDKKTEEKFITGNFYDEYGNFIDGNTPLYKKEKTIKDKMKISVQMVRRFNNWGIRGGLIESSGGVGVDYYLNNDNLMFGLEGWDFGEEDPHLKLYTKYSFAKYFLFNLGWDNFTNSDDQSFYTSLGFVFEDKDLKYLVGLIPMPGL